MPAARGRIQVMNLGGERVLMFSNPRHATRPVSRPDRATIGRSAERTARLARRFTRLMGKIKRLGGVCTGIGWR